MRSILSFSLLTAAALLMTGCSAPVEPVRIESAQSPSTAVSSSKKEVPLVDTCLTLFGETKLANDFATFLADVESLDAETAKKARSYEARIGEVTETAKPELAEPLQVIQAVFKDFAQAWEDSGHWSLDTGTYGAAKAKVGKICGDELDTPAGAQSKTTPTTAPVLTKEEVYLNNLRAAHPAMKSTDTKNMVAVAKNFCLIYDKGAANGKESEAAGIVQQLINAAAGIDYTLQELKSIHKIGVTTFCPQHIDKLN